MGRCYACCQENCPCHPNDERSHSESQGVELPTTPPAPLATFYAVRDPSSGKFYRTYSTHHSSGWIDKLEDARLWTRAGQAKSKITALSNEGKFTPELVEFIVTEVKVVDQKERVAQAKVEKARKEAERLAWIKNERLRQAQSEYDKAKDRLEKLKKGT